MEVTGPEKGVSESAVASPGTASTDSSVGLDLILFTEPAVVRKEQMISTHKARPELKRNLPDEGRLFPLGRCLFCI